MEKLASGSGKIDSTDSFVQLTSTQQTTSGEKILLVDVNAVDKVFGNSQYKDCYAAIYTIAGPTRSGKSFLFSLLWEFLKSSKEEKTSDKWSNNKQKVKKIFQWRKGPNPCTDGIYILKEPFTIPSKKGKIALFLMDTQGIFDHNTSERNQTFLGTFSFLLSSFMFFNVDKGIKTPHLESIYKYATNLRGSDGSFMMQKDSLMFIVRDWMNIETDDDSDDDDSKSNDGNDNDQSFPYGMEGGKKYFKALIRDDYTNKAKEQKMMREYLDHAFGEDIPCCLLPHPGNAVGRKSCSIADLSGDFRRESFKFFQEMTKSNRIIIKRSQNKNYKCGELCETIKDYVTQLGRHLDVADRNSFLLTDFRVKMSRHVRNRVEEFLGLSQEQNVWQGNYDTVEIFESYLVEKRIEMKSKFREDAEKFFPQRVMEEWVEELDRVLSQVSRNLKTSIHVDEAYKKAIVMFSEWQKSNAAIHLEEKGKDFSDKARKIRNDLLLELNKKIKHLEKVEDLEEIFSQCKEYFVNHTNKITAAIDADIEKFLERMKITRYVAISAVVVIGLAALAALTTGLALAFAPAGAVATEAAISAESAGPLASASAGVGARATSAASKAVIGKILQYVGGSTGAVAGAAAKPLTMLGEWANKTAFTKKIKNKAAVSCSDSSLGLQQYDNGQMKVGLSFGILRFKLKIEEN